MLTPQEKVVIIAPRERQRAVIEALYNLQAAHIVEFHEGHDPHGLKFGRPLAEGARASERLVRLRALVRQLGLEGEAASSTLAAAEIERRIDQALSHLEVNVHAIVEGRDRAKQTLKDLEERGAKLRALQPLPLKIEDYRGYDTIRPFVGTVAEPVALADLGLTAADALLVTSGDLVALFVPVAKADAAQEALLRKGFREIEPPSGTGHPADALAGLGRERADAEQKIAKAEEELQKLAREHGDFLLAAEEHLSIEVEKAEAPLGFGATEYTLVIEAWVPTEDVPRVRAALQAAVGDAFHLETRAPGGHGHDEAHDHGAPADAQTVPAEAKHAHEDLPPTKYRNPGFARPFQFFTSMFSMPRYGEIDPTVVLSLAFPLFFGFMIADLGYGTIMAVLGIWMATKLGKIEGMKDLGFGIAVAGIIAMVFGGLVFYDAFGIPFFPHGPHAEEAHSCLEFMEHAGETTWQCIFTGTWPDHAPHAPLSKIGDVSTLLIMSVLAAMVHLSLGLVFGIVNEAKHSGKHAAAKFGWLLLLVAFTYQIFSVARYNRLLGEPVWSVLSNWQIGALQVAGLDLSYFFLGLVGIGVVLLLVTEGGIALLEIPSLLANILSYTRLAGVAVAKAAMAAAFNSLFLVGMAMDPNAGILLVIVGGLLVVLTQLVVLVLGILSSGIQAIRLNYVEFFTKFYKGGGVAFKPFGRDRRYTTETRAT